MTTIIGVRLGDTVTLAADRRCAVNHGRDIVSEQTSKLTRCGPWVIGAAGAHRMGLLVEQHAAQLAGADSIYDLLEILRGLLRADGWRLEPAEPGPSDIGIGRMLVARKGELWHTGSTFCYAEIEEGRPIGTGTGCDWAEGAATAALRLGASAVEAMRMAVQVAGQYDAATGPGLDVVEVGPAAIEDLDTRAYAHATACAQGEHGANGQPRSVSPAPREPATVP